MISSCAGDTATSTLAASGNPNTDLSEAIDDLDLELVGESLRQGADPDGPLVLGLTPLMRAANRDAPAIAEVLIDAGADVEGTGLSGQNALHIAARADAVATLQVLLSAGADPMVRSGGGMNALDTAADAGAIEAIELLATIAGIDLNEPSEVVTQGHGYPRDRGPTPLGLAVRAGRIEAAKKLLEMGAEVDGRSTAGHTPLLLAVFFNLPPEIVHLLLDAGADPEVTARCELGCSVGNGEALTAREWAVELGRDELDDLFSSR